MHGPFLLKCYPVSIQPILGAQPTLHVYAVTEGRARPGLWQAAAEATLTGVPGASLVLAT